MSENIMPIPGSKADKFREQGNRCFQQKDYTAAIHHYSRSLNEQKTVVVLSNRAQTYLNLNKPLLANKDANAAMDLDPSNEKAHYRYFLSLVYLEKKAEAVIALSDHRQFQQDQNDFKICSFLDQLRTPLWGKCVKNSMKINTLQVLEEDCGVIHINVVDSNNKIMRFSSFSDLQQELAEKVHNRVEFVIMTNVIITQEFMECFSSFNPICWSGLLHCDCLELNDYSMKERMPMNEVINYLYYQSNVNSLRRRSLFVGVAQLGGMSFDYVFKELAQKMYSDIQPHPFFFGICGDRDQPQQQALNKNTSEVLVMMKGARGMEILRTQPDNFVR